MAASWIDLASYATKYGVSQSTLRRRIRTKTIPFHMEKGKYYLEDSAETIQRAPLFSRQTIATSLRNQTASDPQLQTLMDENRRLKNQISELETFIKALEAEIDELQTTHGRVSAASTL